MRPKADSVLANYEGNAYVLMIVSGHSIPLDIGDAETLADCLKVAAEKAKELAEPARKRGEEKYQEAIRRDVESGKLSIEKAVFFGYKPTEDA